MSALDEYNAARIRVFPWVEKALADAMRDELLAEVESYRGQLSAATDNLRAMLERAEAAEAELAALKARRCETCVHWDQSCVGPEFGECGLGVADDEQDTTCADFSCSEWTAKEDG